MTSSSSSSHVERAFVEELEHLGKMEHLTAAHIRRNVYLSAQTFDDATSRQLPPMDEALLSPAAKDEEEEPPPPSLQSPLEEENMAPTMNQGMDQEDGEHKVGVTICRSSGQMEEDEHVVNIEYVGLGEGILIAKEEEEDDEGDSGIDCFVEDMRALMKRCTSVFDKVQPQPHSKGKEHPAAVSLEGMEVGVEAVEKRREKRREKKQEKEEKRKAGYHKLIGSKAQMAARRRCQERAAERLRTRVTQSRALRQWRAHLQRKVAARNTLRLRSASSIGSQLTQHERSEICATYGWHRFARMWRDRRMLIVSFSKLVRATVISFRRPDQ